MAGSLEFWYGFFGGAVCMLWAGALIYSAVETRKQRLLDNHSPGGLFDKIPAFNEDYLVLSKRLGNVKAELLRFRHAYSDLQKEYMKLYVIALEHYESNNKTFSGEASLILEMGTAEVTNPEEYVGLRGFVSTKHPGWWHTVGFGI